MPSLFARILKLDRFEPDRIVTSNIVHPRTLVFIRAFGFVYVLAATISVWATTPSAVDYFKYFTHLSYFGLMAYLFASVIWGILYLRQPKSERAHWLKSGSSWWGYSHWILYSTVVTYSVFVPIVFWIFLAWNIGSWTPLELYQNISEHAMDGVLGTIVELIFNRHYLEPVHSLVVAIVMICYMLLTFVIYAIYGDWVYPFLDWSRGSVAAAYYIGIAVALFIVYFVLYFIHKYRNRWLARYSKKVNGDMNQGDQEV